MVWPLTDWLGIPEHWCIAVDRCGCVPAFIYDCDRIGRPLHDLRWTPAEPGFWWLTLYVGGRGRNNASDRNFDPLEAMFRSPALRAAWNTFRIKPFYDFDQPESWDCLNVQATTRGSIQKRTTGIQFLQDPPNFEIASIYPVTIAGTAVDRVWRHEGL